MPTTMPPIALTRVMMIAAIASPRTNFEAPSMAPKNELSSSSSLRRRRASSSVIMPAERSASIAICLPGMASSEKRAATSAMRPAPLVITMKLITTRMANSTTPMTKSPPTTKAAKPLITESGGAEPLVAAGQDQPHGGEVERKTQQRGDQQHGREAGEIERLLDPDRHHQDQHREGDRGGQADIDHPGGHRQHQHCYQQCQRAGEQQVLVSQTAAQPRCDQSEQSSGRLRCRRGHGAQMPTIICMT